MVTLHPSYFMDVVSLVYAYHAGVITWDLHDSFIKQTYRNRTVIAAANGKLALQIPIVHTKSEHSAPYKSIQIDNSQPWASNHLKSIQSAYRSSPFYDYYAHELMALFTDIPEKLQDWNLRTAQYLFKRMNIQAAITLSDDYTANKTAARLVTAKTAPLLHLDNYMQVFQEKFGFLQPLSGLDLLFNEGPSAGVYLKSQGYKLEPAPASHG
ncbi:MAG: WbqC family protein [Nonlabens sp.]|nr:WbqC family protein [Nonlabens sp.]